MLFSIRHSALHLYPRLSLLLRSKNQFGSNSARTWHIRTALALRNGSFLSSNYCVLPQQSAADAPWPRRRALHVVRRTRPTYHSYIYALPAQSETKSIQVILPTVMRAEPLYPRNDLIVHCNIAACCRMYVC